MLQRVEALHPLPSKARALDFGCGVGRLSQPLADNFDEVYGIDISPSMIELARKYNRHGERCRYVLNSSTDLSAFPDRHFNFIYSSITLQHMKPRLAKQYMVEFVRLLAPGGVLVFQLPVAMKKGTVSTLGRLVHKAYYGIYWRLFRADSPVIEMHGMEKEEVARLLEKAGARMLDVTPDQGAGPAWESYSYMATRD